MGPAVIKKLAKALPEKPGVYLFYPSVNYQNSIPLYIGKSINLRKRVLSHLYQAKNDKKEDRMLRQCKYIHWYETAGELGALLLEAQLIKNYLPIYNQRLRKNRYIYSIVLKKNGDRLHPGIEKLKLTEMKVQTAQYGMFRSQRQARAMLEELIIEHQLCAVMLGLESAPKAKSCFAYQLKKCRGACIDQESAGNHNQRLLAALKKYQQQTWPFAGQITLQETSLNRAHTAEYTIDEWRLIKVENLIINPDRHIPQLHNTDFCMDHYRILLKPVLELWNSQQV